MRCRDTHASDGRSLDVVNSDVPPKVNGAAGRLLPRLRVARRISCAVMPGIGRRILFCKLPVHRR